MNEVADNCAMGITGQVGSGADPSKFPPSWIAEILGCNTVPITPEFVQCLVVKDREHLPKLRVRQVSGGRLVSWLTPNSPAAILL